MFRRWGIRRTIYGGACVSTVSTPGSALLSGYELCEFAVHLSSSHLGLERRWMLKSGSRLGYSPVGSVVEDELD